MYFINLMEISDIIITLHDMFFTYSLTFVIFFFFTDIQCILQLLIIHILMLSNTYSSH